MKRGAPANPFSVRFHQPGALPFHFRENESARGLWQRFVEADRRGEIVGSHGTGKTTLLRTLEETARATGEEILTITLHNGERWPTALLRMFTRPSPPAAPQTLILDGAEQLAPVAWQALRLGLRLRCRGLLVTTHRPLGLPLLYRTSIDHERANWVVRQVLAQNPGLPALVGLDSLPEALQACRGNLREVLFRLYDLYEERYSAYRGL